MRNSNIISSIASVVAIAISSVANAVVDVRGALRPQMREHQGLWLEHYLLGKCLSDCKHRFDIKTPRDMRPDGLQTPFGTFALAACTTPRFASVSCSTRG